MTDELPREAIRSCELGICANRAMWWAKTPFFRTAVCNYHKENVDLAYLLTINGCNEDQRNAVYKSGVEYEAIFK